MVSGALNLTIVRIYTSCLLLDSDRQIAARSLPPGLAVTLLFDDQDDTANVPASIANQNLLLAIFFSAITSFLSDIY
jgi:hypothetical protein